MTDFYYNGKLIGSSYEVAHTGQLLKFDSEVADASLCGVYWRVVEIKVKVDRHIAICSVPTSQPII